ncbi:MAG: hypothetical protein GY707_12155 [Desulfobacteraceae bacterium]|nr:hypothetical protein [Desulfobacteraceae bacterium]
MIWFNKCILVDKKPMFCKHLYEGGIHYINDILDDNGNFLCINVVNEKFNVNVKVMTYNSIKDAIPSKWRNIVKGSHTLQISRDLRVCIGNIVKTPPQLKSKEVYWAFVTSIIKPATAIGKWEQLYPERTFDWCELFMVPYYTCRDTSMQCLHYKIINRFYPCKYIVSKWYPNESHSCNWCNETDTLEHHFYKCIRLKYFWSSFFKWWKTVTGICLNLQGLEVTIGIENQNKCKYIDTLNFCILFAKLLIYKENNNNICFYDYQVKLKNRLECELMICTENDNLVKFYEHFSQIYDSL